MAVSWAASGVGAAGRVLFGRVLKLSSFGARACLAIREGTASAPAAHHRRALARPPTQARTHTLTHSLKSFTQSVPHPPRSTRTSRAAHSPGRPSAMQLGLLAPGAPIASSPPAWLCFPACVFDLRTLPGAARRLPSYTTSPAVVRDREHAAHTATHRAYNISSPRMHRQGYASLTALQMSVPGDLSLHHPRLASPPPFGAPTPVPEPPHAAASP